MLRNNLLFLFVFFLSACATTPPPGIQVQVQKVEVPVSVPCKVNIPSIPLYNFDKLNINDDIFLKEQALLSDRLISLGYESELLAALNSCVK